MDRLSKRPLFTVLLFFTLSMFLFCCGNSVFRTVSAAIILLTIVLLTVLSVIKKQRYNVLPAAVLICLGILLGIVRSYIHYDIYKKNIISYCDNIHLITARITDVDRIKSYGSTFTVKVLSVDGNKESFRSKLEIPYEYILDISDTVTVEAAISLPDEYSDSFPLRKYYESDGIYTVITADSVISSNEGDPDIFDKLKMLPDTLSARLRIILGDRVGGLASAVMFGRKSELPDSTIRDFRFIGVSHILAVSGLHLMIIAGLFIKLLRLLGANRFIQHTASSVLILFIMTVSGFSPSVIRAGIMFHIASLAMMTGRHNDSVTSLLAASSLILIFSPSSVSDAAFLLSFSASFGIITMGKTLTSALWRIIAKKLKKKKSLKKFLMRISSSLIMSISAVIFTIPFMMYYFGEISAVSPLSNLIFIPLVTLFLPLSVLTLLLSYLSISFISAPFVVIIGNMMLRFAKLLCRFAPEPISLSYDFTLPLIFIGIGAYILLLFFTKKRKALSMLVSLSLTVSLFSVSVYVYKHNNKDTLRVMFENRNKNDAMILNTDGKTMIIDISDGNGKLLKMSSSAASEFLHDTSPDILLITHLHTKHISSFESFSDSNRLSYLVIPKGSDDNTKYVNESLCAAAEEKDISVIIFDPTEESVIKFGDSEITLLPHEYIKRSTQPFIGFSIFFNGKQVTYLGASVFEGGDPVKYTDILYCSDHVWYGAHGPNIKIPLESFSDSPSFVSNGNVNSLYKTSFPEINGRCVFLLE